MSDRNYKMVVKKATIATLIMFGVAWSFKAFYAAFVPDYDKEKAQIVGEFNYDFDNPDDKIKLSSKYDEISGLEYRNGNIYFIIDEQEQLFGYSLTEGIVRDYTTTDRNEDYEGVAIVDSLDFMINSSGDILRMSPGGTFIMMTRYKSEYSMDNDIEGLCYDKANNRLLIACKGKPLKDIEKDHKGIYAFDLNKNEFIYKAVFDVSNKDVFGDKRKKKDSFGPSGIAIHPITGEVYVIAHEGKVIFALDKKGKVVKSRRLDPKIFKQPEGICFNEAGDLYISNEANGGTANILYFKYKP